MLLAEIRDPNCTLCRMSDGLEKVCEMGVGSRKASIMVVGKMPNSKTYQDTLEAQLTKVGINLTDVYFTSAIKCRNFDRSPSNGDVKTCRTYLDAEIEAVQPQWILALGNEALLALTGHSGIMKYRGRPITKSGATVIPTISPSSVTRNPGQYKGYMADLLFFAAQVKGETIGIAKPDIRIIDTREKLDKFKRLLRRVSTIVYDIESVDPGTEFDPGARMVSISYTFVYTNV